MSEVLQPVEPSWTGAQTRHFLPNKMTASQAAPYRAACFFLGGGIRLADGAVEEVLDKDDKFDEKLPLGGRGWTLPDGGEDLLQVGHH